MHKICELKALNNKNGLIKNFKKRIETGLLIEGRVIIIECKDVRHRQKRIDRTSIDKALLRAREVESLYSYRYTGLREGD